LQNLFFAECAQAEEIVSKCQKVLTTPAPACVPIEDTKMLIFALRMIGNNPGDTTGPLFTSGILARKVISDFTTKYPL